MGFFSKKFITGLKNQMDPSLYDMDLQCGGTYDARVIDIKMDVANWIQILDKSVCI